MREQPTFLVEVDRLKTIVRRSPLAAAERRENDAEHSWHLAMMVIVLAEHADEPIDVGHTLRLVLVHDLVEIYAGDTPPYDDAAAADQRERETKAAGELFSILPADQADRLRRLWDEFEERRTPEARFAKALDRLQPLLLAGPGPYLEGLRRHGRRGTRPQVRHRRRLRRAVEGRATAHRRGRGPRLDGEPERV